MKYFRPSFPALLLLPFVFLGARSAGHAAPADLVVQEGHRGYAPFVAYSPNGRIVASASMCDPYEGSNVRLWEAGSGRLLRVMDGSGPVAFSPDGAKIAFQSGTGGCVEIHDSATGDLVRRSPQYIPFGGRITALSFSVDSKCLTDVAYGYKVRGRKQPFSQTHYWNITTGKLIASFRIARLDQVELGFSSGAPLNMAGRIGSTPLLAGNVDGALFLWDLKTGKGTKLGTNDAGKCQIAAISPDGSMLATLQQIVIPGEYVKYGSEDGGEETVYPAIKFQVCLWNAVTGKHTVLLDKSDRMFCLTFSGNGHTLTACSGDAIWQWVISPGDIGHGHSITPGKADVRVMSHGQLALTRDGVTIAVGGNVISLVESVTGKVLWQSPPGSNLPLAPVTFSPDGHSLLTRIHQWPYKWDVPMSGAACLAWDLRDGIPKGTITDHAQANSGEWPPDQSWLGVAGEKHRAHFFKLLDKCRKTNEAAVFSGDGRWMAVSRWEDESGERSLVDLWEVSTARLRHTFHGVVGCVTWLKFSRDGKWLAASSRERGRTEDFRRNQTPPCYTALWNTKTKKAGIRARRGGGALAFSPDGSLLLVSDITTSSVQVWRTGSGAWLRRIAVGTSGAMNIAVSPDGKTMLCNTRPPHCLELWDLASGRSKGVLGGRDNQFTTALFSPDGSKIVTGRYDGALRWWDASTRKLLLTQKVLLERNDKNRPFRWIAFTPGGLYDGSPGVEKILFWREDGSLRPDGPDAAHHRMDLVQAVLNTK